ncbi:MAG: ChaN family lipoprotein [Phycisphaerales bacterium]|nr:ChaN family lipoprotein [Phycisphaerales bacterium]
MSILSQVVRFTMLTGAATTLIGCSTPTRDSKDVMVQAPRSVTIYHGDGSGVASWESVVADMATAKAVLIGEMHGHELGLAVAAEMFDDILESNPDAMLSMEFYERDDQLAIDDYLAGITDRKGFEKASGRTKGNNPPGHEQMVEAAKNAARPIIAANAPRRYTKLARTDGYNALRLLNDRQRVLFDIPPSIRTETDYRERFYDVMSAMAQHGGEEMIHGFYRSQSLWDRTMASSIAKGARTGSPVVHMVGYFHTQFGTEPGGSGLVDDLREMLQPDDKIVTFVMLDRADQPVVDEDLGIADYVIYVGTDDEEE